MDKIKTVGDMRALISDLDDDFKIELGIRQKLSDEELKNMSYPYPYKTQYTNLVFDDIGYSDKSLCLGCELKSDDTLHESKDDNNVKAEVKDGS